MRLQVPSRRDPEARQRVGRDNHDRLLRDPQSREDHTTDATRDKLILDRAHEMGDGLSNSGCYWDNDLIWARNKMSENNDGFWR